LCKRVMRRDENVFEQASLCFGNIGKPTTHLVWFKSELADKRQQGFCY